MRIGFWNLYPELNDALFTNPNAPIGDDLLRPFNVLGEMARERGHVCEPLDPTRPEAYDALVFIDFPATPLVAACFAAKRPCYLITFEPPVVRPLNWERMVHAAFQKVFTWDDSLVGTDPRYVKMNYAFDRQARRPSLNSKSRFCTLIASNKTSPHPLELYSARRQTIGWFEQNRRAHLDLYGPGWTGGSFDAVYHGVIAPGGKRAVLSRYRFAICYENAQGLAGYITEKIFDCFIAGVVPVYWGAPNVSRYIPPSAFIDRRDFKDEAALFERLLTMTDQEYALRVQSGRHFLDSSASDPFTVETFARTILDGVTR